MPHPCDVMRLTILVQFTHLADIVSREVGDVEGGGWGKPGIEICPNLCTAEYGMWAMGVLIDVFYICEILDCME